MEQLCERAKKLCSDIRAIADELANEARLAEKDKQRNRPVINQLCDFVGQSLVQQHAMFGITTDLAQSWKANLGPLQSELAHPKATDPVGLCIAQFDKISRQQQEPSQPTAATSAQPAEIHLSEQLQRLDTQIEQSGIARAAAYKKAIKLTMARQGKPEVVE